MDMLTLATMERPWRSARTLKDLGELTACWLEGGFQETPTYGGRPHPETTDLVPTLAAANRAGFLTDQSQPGTPQRTAWDGLPYWQRAAVQGHIADRYICRHLTHFIGGAGALPQMEEAGTGEYSRLIVRVRPAPWRRFDHRTAVPVTIGPDGVHTSFGSGIPERHLRWLYRRMCSKPAVDAVCSAMQVTIVDPVWGRNDVLWPMLDLFAEVVGERTG